jgi:hypothetical protein
MEGEECVGVVNGAVEKRVLFSRAAILSESVLKVCTLISAPEARCT